MSAVSWCAATLALGLAALVGPNEGEQVTRFADPAIVESSGLVATGGRFVTVNDSGDSARIFVVDARTGRTVREVVWGSEAVDVEALAPAAGGAVWVADIGDNTASRTSVRLAHVALDGSAVTSYDVRYPGGPADAETLLRHPGTDQLFVVTKSVFGGRVLAAPTELRAARVTVLRDVGDVAGLVTDGAFFPDGRHLVVRNYTRAFVYAFPTFDLVAAFDLPEQEQGEGLAVVAADTLVLSSEGVGAPLLRVRVPAHARAALLPSAGQPSPQPTPPTPRTAEPAASPTEATDRPARLGWLALGAAVVSLAVAWRLRRPG